MGQRALARELGRKGRWHGEQMAAAHRAAAARIFGARNPGATGAGGGAGARLAQQAQQGGVTTLDLHGLHVPEALEQLERVLVQLAHGGSRSAAAAGSGAARLRVVVGVGQHGRVPARLPAAVRQFLSGQGLAVAEPYGGLLEVVLP